MRIKKIVVIVSALISVLTWCMAVTNWFKHNDHAALGWFALSVITAQYASTVMGQR